MKKFKIKKTAITDGLFFAVGVVLYAISVNVFLVPAKILPGGLTGVAAAIAQVTGLGQGYLLLALNIPVLYLGYKRFGVSFILKTAVVTVMVSAALEYFDFPALVFKGERMLACLAGGVLLGAGIGIIMLRGATTAGTDIIAKFVNSKKPSLSVGRVILLGDIVSVSLAGLVFGDLSSVLYSMIAMYAAARVTDLILYGAGGGKALYAVTEKGRAVSDAIFSSIGRGVTMLPAAGGYTGNQKTVVFCACRRDEINRAVSAVTGTDPSAFITVCDAGDVIGEGFKR